MAYKFKQELLSTSKFAIKAPFSITPKYITVHNTANDASAANEISYMRSNNNEVSYHVAVDDKEIIQAIPFNRNAWHCGDGRGPGNMSSIGIEICYSKSGGSRYAAAEENAVQYIAALLKQFNWGIDRVKKHQDWSGKYCPHRILAENRWNSFLKRVEAAMSAQNKKEEDLSMTQYNELKKQIESLERIVSEQQQLLNTTGRKEAREMIKRGVNEKLFLGNHEGVEKYNDVELLSYALAYANRKTK